MFSEFKGRKMVNFANRCVAIYVEDEASRRTAVRSALVRAGFKTCTASSIEIAERMLGIILRKIKGILVPVTDWKLDASDPNNPGKSALAVIEMMRKGGYGGIILVHTAGKNPTIEEEIKLLQKHCPDEEHGTSVIFVQKEESPEDCERLLRSALLVAMMDVLCGRMKKLKTTFSAF